MESKKPRLLLVDGNALVHRAFHALPPLTVPKTGEPIGAVYGFAMMLVKAINDLRPTHYAIAFDRKAPTFRHQLFDQYKAHRPKMDDELAVQFGRVREVVNSFGIPIFEMDGYEADDILGALSAQARRRDLETVILTGDADMMQLVSPKIKVYYPRPGGSFSDAMLYDEEAVKKRYGVDPPQIADIKALKGDPSDNIPGVPGVGDKTALKLVKQFGNVEKLLERLDEVEPVKLKEKLKENIELIKRSHELATIDQETPVTLDFDECCQIDRYDRSLAADLFRELGFNSLLSKLPETNTAQTAPETQPAAGEQTESAEPVEIGNGLKYETVTSIEALDALISRLSAAESLALSTAGSVLSSMNAKIVGISFSAVEGEAWYVPVTPPATFPDGNLPLDVVLSRCKPLLENASCGKNIHNGKYDLILLAENGINLNNLTFDTMVAAYLLGDKSLGLKEIVFSRTGLEIVPASSLVGSGSSRSPCSRLE